MPRFFFSTVINAPIDRVWKSVSDFNGLPAWMPGILESSIEDDADPSKIGAVRRMKMADGTEAREELVERSDEDRRISYVVLQAPIPVKNVRNTMQLRPITDLHGTLAEWVSEFETEKGGEDAGAEFLRRVFSSGYRGLKRYLGV